MTPEELTKSTIALASWKYGHPNGLNGCLAIMFVIRNRVKAGWNSGDWYKNASVLLHGSLPSDFPADCRETLFQAVCHSVDAVYEDTPDKLTHGALYFDTEATENVLHYDEQLVARVGNLSLYKEKKKDGVH